MITVGTGVCGLVAAFLSVRNKHKAGKILQAKLEKIEREK
jgi:hypothetical protein